MYNAYLTPDSSEENDAEVAILQDVIINTTSNSWFLTANDQTGFHLSLLLSQSNWSPDPTLLTKYILKINSNSIIGTPGSSGRDLIVTFSQNTIQKYITTILSIDEEIDHILYPSCDLDTPQSWASGDILSQINNPTSLSRQEKATNGDLTGRFLPTSSMSPDVAYPLTFILVNDPMSNILTYTYTNPGAGARSCLFNNISTSDDIDIYFAAADIGQNFDISSLNITKIIVNGTISDGEEEEDSVKFWEEPGFWEWEFPIMIGSLCCCVLCIFLAIRFRKKRSRRQNDKKLAYALQMANSTPSFEQQRQAQGGGAGGNHVSGTDFNYPKGQKQHQNNAIAVPTQTRIAKGASKDNLVPSRSPSPRESMISVDTGTPTAGAGGHVTKTRGMTSGTTPEPPEPPIKHAPADYVPTGDSLAPSPPLPPTHVDAFQE